MLNEKYKWEFCCLCGVWFIYCPTCGNNSCNGGSGEIEGKPCPDCPAAYDYQDSFTEEQWDEAGLGGLPNGEKPGGRMSITLAKTIKSIEAEQTSLMDNKKIIPNDTLSNIINHILKQRVKNHTITISDDEWKLLDAGSF